MIAALVVVSSLLLLIPAVVAIARVSEAVRWRRTLVGMRVVFPSGLTPEDVANWLAGVAAATHAQRGALLPLPPILLEVVATQAGIEHRLFVPEQLKASVLSSLRASLPGVRLEDLAVAAATVTKNVFSVAAQLRLAGKSRQLGIERAESASRNVLASLQPLGSSQTVTWQWTISGAGTPQPLTLASGKKSSENSLPWWLDGQTVFDADELRAARLKQREPLLHVAGRVLVAAENRAQAYAVFGRVWAPMRQLNVPGARLVRGFWPVFLVRDWVIGRWVPVTSWPLLLNTKELSGLLAVPMGELALPGVASGSARQLPPTTSLPMSGVVLADSTYPGNARPLAMHRVDRLMHTWLGGPTGVGKSTLMANLAIQDMAAGDGLALIDAKGDLVTDLLARIPAGREQDVVVFDPGDTAQPVGFNILRMNASVDPELAVDHVLHVLKEQWAAFWGPRTEMVLRAALLTLAEARSATGEHFALTEVAELLTNDRFRAFVSTQPRVPASARDFWVWFESLSAGERTQVIGPVLNKLDAFTSRTPLRLMLGQSTGIDLTAAMRERKILLVPLDRGRIGAETAALVGSLMVTALWQTALGRTAIPTQQRRPWWLYIDEAQEVVRLPVAIADMLAEARGLKVGMTLANQHLAQLPDSVRRAVLSTVRSQVVFQTEPEDARVLARSFEPYLAERDLRALPAYEVAMRLAVDGQTSRPVTGKTRPTPEPTSDGEAIRQASRNSYGAERAAIELALKQRAEVPRRDNGAHSFGSRRQGGTS